MECTEADLENIGKRVRDALAAESSAGDMIRHGRVVFLEEVARRNAASVPRRSSRHISRRWVSLVFAAGLGASAAGLWFWMRPVTFQVGEARPGRLGDVIESLDGRPTPLHFSEGSSLLLHEGGRMRVLTLESNSARVLVEDGVLDVNIAHRTGGKSRWDFEAGPYRVLVTGTRFQMTYFASDQSFGLATEEGQVIVSGGCQKTPTIVAAGERIDLACPAPEMPSWVRHPLEESRPEGLSAGPNPAETKTAQRETVWRELLASGRLSEGLHAAERANFQKVCQRATAKELLALADAARLFGPQARAVTALRILRQRFPGSMEAATAAFTLGRIAFERRQAYSEAAQWFETYLREQPSGPLMGDSVGRLMEARLRSGDRVGARADAQQYLRRFPEGPYASEARGILSR
jgi:transmembrane sensor